MANAYFYSNIATPTTLSGNINNSVTSCTVASTTGWPGSFPYIVALDFGTANEELVRVNANAAGTLTIVRAFGGTSAVSHSTGAPVRHVYNAQDATDFRTHEAATGATHGVAGAFVGTTDSQTLTNKTLTAPAISNPTITGGGSLSGTFSGTPTFSGAIVLSGTPSINNGAALAGTFTGTPTFNGALTFSAAALFTGSPIFQGAAAANAVLNARVSGDAQQRLIVGADGKMLWGSGAATGDTNLYRDSANILATDDTFRVYGATTATDAYQSRVTGDTQSRFNMDADGTMSWGSGSAVQDTNLYRSAADVLKTDDTFAIGAAATLLLGTSGDVNLYRSAADLLATDDALTVGGNLTHTGSGIRYHTAAVGTATVSMSAVAQQDLAVNFGVTFPVAPVVVVSGASIPSGSSALIYRVFSTTTTGFTLRVNDVGGVSRTLSVDVSWIAVAV